MSCTGRFAAIESTRDVNRHQSYHKRHSAPVLCIGTLHVRIVDIVSRVRLQLVVSWVACGARTLCGGVSCVGYQACARTALAAAFWFTFTRTEKRTVPGCCRRSALSVSRMALGASQQQRASEPWRVRNLIDLYEEGGECGTADVNRTSNSSQATDLASAFAQPFRGFLLPCLDPSNPSCPTSCHNKLSNEQNSAVEHSHSKIAIRASTEGLAVCTARESPCSNTPRSAASSSLDSPLKIFQALQQPCSPSSDSSFIPSYQDLNCTRVAAFADVAAAPSLLASCKNGTFSPSPPASCLSSREPSPRGSVHRDQDDAYTIDHASVRLFLSFQLHV